MTDESRPPILECAHRHRQRVVGCVSCVLVFDRPAESRPPDDTPPWIACPDCGQIVNQVASATLALALWQHQNWVCKGHNPVALAKQKAL